MATLSVLQPTKVRHDKHDKVKALDLDLVRIDGTVGTVVHTAFRQFMTVF